MLLFPWIVSSSPCPPLSLLICIKLHAHTAQDVDVAHAPVTPVDPGHGCSRSRSPTTLHRAAVAAPSQDKDEPFSQRSFIQMPILEYMTFGRPRTLREAPRELTAGANQACNYTPDVRPLLFP